MKFMDEIAAAFLTAVTIFETYKARIYSLQNF
jgi:hypothetical protein